MICPPQSKRSGTIEYRSQYDDAYRLTREKCTPGGGSSRMAYDYRYYFDGVGNRTKFIRTDLWTSDRTVVYEYSARNELTRYSDPEGSGKYWVCEYDLRGNRTKWRHTFWTDSWYSYGWDAQDRLTKVYSNSNTKTTEYKYDHAGRRAAKRVNSGAGFGAWTWYSYDGLKVVAEGTSTTSKMYYTTAPGDPGGIICRDASAGTNPLYYHYDRLGNVMAVTDSNGALCAPYTMDAFGNVLQCGTSTGYSATQSDPQPYHLTTKEWDPDSALFYFNARWYERGIGTFVSRDALSRPGEDAYSFVRNNPLAFADIDGNTDTQTPTDGGGTLTLNPPTATYMPVEECKGKCRAWGDVCHQRRQNKMDAADSRWDQAYTRDTAICSAVCLGTAWAYGACMAACKEAVLWGAKRDYDRALRWNERMLKACDRACDDCISGCCQSSAFLFSMPSGLGKQGDPL